MNKRKRTSSFSSQLFKGHLKAEEQFLEFTSRRSAACVVGSFTLSAFVLCNMRVKDYKKKEYKSLIQRSTIIIKKADQRCIATLSAGSLLKQTHNLIMDREEEGHGMIDSPVSRVSTTTYMKKETSGSASVEDLRTGISMKQEVLSAREEGGTKGGVLSAQLQRNVFFFSFRSSAGPFERKDLDFQRKCLCTCLFSLFFVNVSQHRFCRSPSQNRDQNLSRLLRPAANPLLFRDRTVGGKNLVQSGSCFGFLSACYAS